jgi:Protein of unknown function (DUF1553)/Protein of unknown function (DUF1549)
MPKVRFWIGGSVLLAWALPVLAAPAEGDKRRADALALAATIDRHLGKGWADNKIVPSAPIDDGAFLRRVYLHLGGRIPSVYEVRRFLDDKADDKRVREVERLLAGQRYPLHMAHVWRALLLPEASAGSETRGFGPPLEGWLRSRFAANVPYDKIVRELLMVAPNGAQPNRLALDLYGFDPGDGTSPLVFYQAKQFKPENLAEATARTFLGVRLGCAQCHNHPTADWKREQFWEFAAFFTNIGQPNQQLVDKPANRELKIPDTQKVVQAKFLDGKAPAWKEKDDPRAVLAEWLTRKDNPYFARATVNRVWAYFFGAGIIEPVDEMVGADNSPSHPALLDELAREFAAHDFDLKYLFLAITSSKAYQLSSIKTHPTQDEHRQFARAPLLGMTPEQLFDSVAEATRYGANGGRNDQFAFYGSPAREEFLAKFHNVSDRPTEYQTSIIQALMLMNGQLTADATSLERSQLLSAVLGSPFMDTPQRIETLYLATLTRQPSDKEMARATRFIDDALKAGDKPVSQEEKDRRYKHALADLFWALLNSGEFFFNH